MNGMLLATYVLRTQHQMANRPGPAVDDERTHQTGRRALVALATVFAGIAGWAVLLDRAA